MYVLVVLLHIVASVALILIVLLQTGRGAEMGAAFGGASQTLFGGSGGSSFMSKLTTGAAVVFMVTCLGLTYLSGGVQTKSIMENVPVEKPQLPAIPEAKPVQSDSAQSASPDAPSKPQESAATSGKPEAAQVQDPSEVGTKAGPSPSVQDQPPADSHKP